MKLAKPLLIAQLLTTPALAVDLSASTYLGLQQSEIKANYKCAPTFLTLGGGRRMICRRSDRAVFTFILKITHSSSYEGSIEPITRFIN